MIRSHLCCSLFCRCFWRLFDQTAEQTALLLMSGDTFETKDKTFSNSISLGSETSLVIISWLAYRQCCTKAERLNGFCFSQISQTAPEYSSRELQSGYTYIKWDVERCWPRQTGFRCWMIFWRCQPGLLFSPTTHSGGKRKRIGDTLFKGAYMRVTRACHIHIHWHVFPLITFCVFLTVKMENNGSTAKSAHAGLKSSLIYYGLVLLSFICWLDLMQNTINDTKAQKYIISYTIWSVGMGVTNSRWHDNHSSHSNTG